MRVTQVLVAAAPGDAVTNSALDIAAFLDPITESAITAVHVDPALAAAVVPLDRVDEGRSLPEASDVLLLHISIGEPGLASWVLSRPERLVIYYHNISPAESYTNYDSLFAERLRLGRAELAAYRDRTVLALAASEYSGHELRDVGYRSVKVVPLVFDPTRLTRRPPHAPTASHLVQAVRGPVVLFVGQLLPHKRPDFLIEAFYVLNTHILPESHLIMVGAARLPGFRYLIQAFVSELQLPTVWLTGAVSDDELATFYRRADVFATASEHEGFCAPVLEAMAFDVPVVARSFAAVPATVGDAGVLLGPDAGPVLFAETVAAVIEDRRLQFDLARRGRRRVQTFDATHARNALAGSLTPLL